MAAHRLLIYLPWLGRNIILSGYLVYPRLPWTFSPRLESAPGYINGGLFSNKLLAERVSFRDTGFTHGNLHAPSFRECSSPG